MCTFHGPIFQKENLAFYFISLVSVSSFQSTERPESTSHLLVMQHVHFVQNFYGTLGGVSLITLAIQMEYKNGYSNLFLQMEYVWLHRRYWDKCTNYRPEILIYRRTDCEKRSVGRAIIFLCPYSCSFKCILSFLRLVLQRTTK